MLIKIISTLTLEEIFVRVVKLPQIENAPMNSSKEFVDKTEVGVQGVPLESGLSVTVTWAGVIRAPVGRFSKFFL